jgi:hypothetical protein
MPHMDPVDLAAIDGVGAHRKDLACCANSMSANLLTWNAAINCTRVARDNPMVGLS